MKMGVAGVLVTVILIHLLYSRSGYTQDLCDRGWFGPRCQYRCRCVNDQCDVNGNCTSQSACQKRWFGPACQYYNLVSIGQSSYGSIEITDEDDSTCKRYGNFMYMSTTWSAVYHFSWLRLRVSKPGAGPLINVSITNNGTDTTCADLTRVTIDNRTLDIHCPVSVLMNQIELKGSGVNFMCSLYISGGRNVALKEKTWQSSTFTDDDYNLDYSKSDNAVDGNPSGTFTQKSCAHTATQMRPTWNVSLTKPRLVNRYVVYNRVGFEGRLRGFILESYNTSEGMVLQYRDDNKTNTSYTIIDTKIDQQVHRVSIYLTGSGLLALCEVELYGDSVCPHGRYGRDCGHTCNCDNKSDSCFVSTGGCPSGCPAGFYGEGCRQVCDIGRYGKGCTAICGYKCAKVACDATNGACVDGCSQGYKPPFCNEECDVGFHGYNCTEPCSNNCNGSCNKQTGSCLNGCLPGYEGAQCDKECDVTFYGVGCQQPCLSSCLNSDCHHVTGVCKECPPGKRGDQCVEVCSSGTYGQKCANNCSKNCHGSEGCDVENGACKSGCTIGYEGAMCEKTCESMRFGENCKSNCSQFCAVDVNQNLPVCHHISGECRLGCTSDYEGQRCVKLKLTDSGGQSGAIAGPIVAVLLLVVILIIGMFVWRRRKSTKSSNDMITGSRPSSGLPESRRNSTSTNGPTLVLDRPSSHPSMSGLTPNGKNNEEIYYNTASDTHKTAIAVSGLNTFMQSHPQDYFAEQFKSIPISSNASMAVGLSAENKNKNRYKNISAYDHSRVQLIANIDKLHGDYINASYIQGYNKKETFIASQGPSKVILADFIRLLWEQKSDIVVMLTNLVEDGKQKCEQYWPDASDLELGELKVKLISSQVLSDCVIRKLQLRKESEATHTVTQYHFTSWPDKSVPATSWGLIDFQRRVFSHPTNKAIVVHCSAGVGRTGTFIALRNVIQEAEDTGYMDFYTTLSKLRQDRINMIQTVEQYIFLHEAAQAALVCQGTTVTTSDVSQKIDGLDETTDSGQTNMEKEFKAVCDLCASNSTGSEEEGSGGSYSSTYMNSRMLVNKVKNRFSNVLPKDYYRPRLFCETKDMGEYINAVMLPSLTNQNSQILTQLPLQTTVTDFWRLVSQYNVSLIVAFELHSNDSTVGAYIPSESGVPLQCGPFEIKITAEESSALWEEKVLFVVKQKKKKPSLTTSSIRTQEHQVTHLKCAKCGFDPSDLLAFIQKMRTCRKQDKSRILFMCRNGAHYSGLVCVLNLLLDGIDTDNQVTVPLVVGTVKTVRPQVIPTLDQYRTLYQVLNLYCDTNNVYSNCSDVIPNTETAIDIGVSNNAFEDNEVTSEKIYENF